MNQLQIPFDGSERPTAEGERNTIRPIHYLGSKLRMLSVIEQVLDQVDPGRGITCDLFCGSGVVSSHLSAKREMVAVDIQEYARTLSNALVNPIRISEEEISSIISGFKDDEHSEKLCWAMEPLISAEETRIESAAQGNLSPLYDLLEAGSVVRAEIDGIEALPRTCQELFEHTHERLREMGLSESVKATTTRYYGGLYFGFLQSIKLDYLLSKANSQAENRRDLLVAAILSTASEVTPTVGNQFAQPLRPRKSDGSPKGNVWRRVAEARSEDVFEKFRHWVRRYSSRAGDTKDGEAVRADFREFLASSDHSVSAFYVDPPYTRDHYSRYYHVLETMCLRDNPDITKSRSGGKRSATRGLYREGRHQSPFCIKSKAPGAFEELFSLLRGFDAPAVLSYSPGSKDGGSRPRVMDLREVISIAESNFRSVAQVEVSGISHSKLNNRDRQLGTPEEAESIIVCKP
jgi:adenine-specific DNA methylase